MRCLLCREEGVYREDLRCEDFFCSNHHDQLAQAEHLMEERLIIYKDMNTAAIIQEYVQQKDLIREAEARIKELQFSIKQFAEVDDVFDIDIATVTVVKGRATYEYSDDIKEREQALKEAKKYEEQTGAAAVIEGEPYLVCKFKK